MRTNPQSQKDQNSAQLAVWQQWMLDRGLIWPTPSLQQSEPASVVATNNLAATSQSPACVFVSDFPCAGDGAAFTQEEAQLFEKMMNAAGIENWHVIHLEANHPDLGKNIVTQIPLRPETAQFLRNSETKVVVTLGDLAARAVLGMPATQRVNRGVWHDRRDLPRIFPMLHPRDLIRWPINKRETWGHLQDLAANLRNVASTS